MILFWLCYDSLRMIEPLLLPRVAVSFPFRLESRLFLSPDGTIWPFYFARRNVGDNIMLEGMRLFSQGVYLTQLFAIPVLFLMLWQRGHALLFRRFLWSFTALHIMTLVVYLAYPAAPPWWVFENGFAVPTPENSAPTGYPAGSLLHGLFQISPNRFAAIPSLHGAYPLLLTLVLLRHGVRSCWLLLAAAYTVAMWFASVFLNQHYIVDLVAGAALVPFTLPFASDRENRMLRPSG